MKILKHLALITMFCITIPTTMLCTNDSPQPPINDFKNTVTEKAIELKNNIEGYYQPIKPYIYNPIGFAGACLISSIVGLRKITAAVILGCVIAASREIIKYMEETEKSSNMEKNDSSKQKA